MDWFSWLSNTGLEPSLVYEYGLAFCHNELEEDDIAYLDHEFLQSMGISIAKHRLEIMKLARKEISKGQTPTTIHPMMSSLVYAIKHTKRSLSKYIQTWRPVSHRENSAGALVPRGSLSGSSSTSTSINRFWKGVMLRRSRKKMRMLTKGAASYNNNKQQRQQKAAGGRVLMLTTNDGSPMVFPQFSCFSSPMVHHHDLNHNNNQLMSSEGDLEDEVYGVQEVRWDTMFQDLKPT